MASFAEFALGLVIPESPRWHEGTLWLADAWAGEVLQYQLDGTRRVVHRFGDDEEAGGLGWLSDGRLLVAENERRILYLIDDGQAVVHAELGHLAPFQLADMVVAADGTSYVSHFGFDLYGGGPRRPTVLIRVTPDGVATGAADDMHSPNGMAISGDGRTLVVSEPGAARLSRFAVTPDGLQQRVLIPLEKAPGAERVTPDGLCLDADGGVWVADPYGHRMLHIGSDAAAVDHVVELPDAFPLACVLGGPERRTLFVCVATHVSRARRSAARTGRILSFDVDVPGDGTP